MSYTRDINPGCDPSTFKLQFYIGSSQTHTAKGLYSYGNILYLSKTSQPGVSGVSQSIVVYVATTVHTCAGCGVNHSLGCLDRSPL